jgi:hypothetical protein
VLTLGGDNKAARVHHTYGRHSGYLAAHTQPATKMPQIGVLSLGRGDKSDASLATLSASVLALRELEEYLPCNITRTVASAIADAIVAPTGKVARRHTTAEFAMS